MELYDLLSKIKPVDKDSAKICREHFNKIAKPVGSLGMLEELLIGIAAVTGSAEIDIGKKAVTVFCADNGIVSKGVAMHSHKVTTAVAALLVKEKASVSVMAQTCGADVFPIDVGMVDTVEGLYNRKLMCGTNDMTEGFAMNRETAEKALNLGIDMVYELKNKGYNIIATGEVGIGNTSTSSAVCSVLLNRSPCDVTGRGAGLDDAGLLRKIAAIERAIAVNKPNPADPVDVLSKVGGLDIAAMAGVFLGGGLYNIPVVMDGFISGTAALIAVRLCPYIRDYILPSHKSNEPGAEVLMRELKLSPIIEAGMRLGEGTGAVSLFPVLDMAASVYKNAATYDDIQLESNP